VTSVLTRDPGLEAAQQPVVVSYAAPTTRMQPAAARRRSTVAGRHAGPAAPPLVDVVDQWGMHSFPASDPPANW
jgi:hypothetical protein